jgi:toxin HigB-1
MIISFRRKDLKDLFEVGKTGKIDHKLHKRIINRLDALDHATAPSQMNVPGFDFHELHGFKPPRYSVFGPRQWAVVHYFRI